MSLTNGIQLIQFLRLPPLRTTRRNMGNLLLNTGSIIMCPHGGLVSHSSTTWTTYRISGRPPMLQTDLYIVSGCPFSSPCTSVQWVTGSTMLLVKGIPVLTVASVGICSSASMIPNGPAIISSTQLGEREPDTF